MVMLSKMLVDDHSKILEFGNILQLIIVGYKSYVIKSTYFVTSPNDHNGLPYPADEWTLCLFVSFTADSIQYSSIKVYLSAVHSLHMEQGFSYPLLNCLQLQ